MRTPVYVRLVAVARWEAHPRAWGIFQAAGEVDWGIGPRSRTEEEADEVRGHLRWFAANLPAPPRRRMQDPAVCWFKPEARGMIARSFDLASLLAGHGYGIGLVRTTRPGAIVYEDPLQVAAVPFRDTWTLPSGPRVRPILRPAR